jgi:hypothetical protein
MYYKMPFTKKAKNEAVHVETRKISGDHCGSAGMCCGKRICHLIWGLLLLANLVVLVMFYCQYTHTEAMKVGGSANYKLVKQIYNTKAFQDGQAQQIQQALQQYETPTAAPTTQTPTVQVQPSVDPTTAAQ